MSYTKLVSSLLFPLHERLKGHDSVRRRRFLERSQWWSRDELLAHRQEKLQRFLKRVGQTVPYYRTVLAGRTPELVELPFLTKDIIRENLDALKAEGARHLSLYNTGGSTGQPLQFYIGRERVSHDIAAKWRATRWWGVDIGDPEIVVWGSPIELGAQDRVRELRDRLFRTKLVPAFEMSEKNLDGFVEAIVERKPRMLFGYPSSLALIARHARSRGVDLKGLGIRVAFVTAEQLFEDQVRDIEEGFACRVANGYGGRDLGFAAHQCPEGGLHVMAEDIWIEVVDPDGRVLPTGEEGEIVVTHLATAEFPFIRYRTGDVGVLSERVCSCRRGLPLLEAVRGRTTDFVVAEDGTVMHALALIYAIRDVPGVRNFKIVQEDLHQTRVLLVVGEGFPESHEDDIRKRLAARLGTGVRISMERVEEIPRSRSGKHRYVESRIPIPLSR